MKAISIILALLIGVGCLSAAVWMSQSNVKPGENLNSQGDPGPEISSRGPYPRAVIGETEFDFGTRLRDSAGDHTFVIRNTGEAPLVLMARNEDRTCQCTGAELGSKDPIPPGGEVPVKVSWKIKSPAPQFRHSAKIRTNDPENKVIELVIKGITDNGFYFEPAGEIWDLGVLGDDESQNLTEWERNLVTKSVSAFEITEFVCKNPRVTCTWTPLDEEALSKVKATAGYAIKLKLDLTNFTGRLNEPLEFKTDSPNQLSGHTKLTVTRAGPVEFAARGWDAEHGVLFLPEFSADKGVASEIIVTLRDPNEMVLLSTESSCPEVTVTWEKDARFQSKTGKMQRFLLKVNVAPGAPANHKRADCVKIELKFDHPKIQSLPFVVDYLSI